MGIPRNIGGIQLFAELAQGPTTVVFKGYDRSLDRFVLLKVLQSDYAHDPVLAQRFEEEARLAARIQHPNVVAVYAYGREAGHVYLASEFVEGNDLRQLLAAGPLPFDLAVFILREAAAGLQAAHAKAVLHRDIKPSNLMVSAQGEVKLTDFGLSSLIEEEGQREIRGTLSYLAPELVRGEGPLPASDLFSLGALFYEMLAARTPFDGGEAGETLDLLLNYDPMPALRRDVAVPEDLFRICAKLLDKAPARRYATCEALLQALAPLTMADAGALCRYAEAPEDYRTGKASPENAPASVVTEATVPGTAVAPVKQARRRYALPVVLGLLLVLAFAYTGATIFGEQNRVDPAATTALPPGSEDPASGLGSSAEDSTRSDLMEQSEAPKPSTDERLLEQVVYPDTAGVEAPNTTTIADDPAVSSPRHQALLAQPGGERPLVAGSLQVTSEPWSVVYVEGDSVGITPLTPALSLAPGRYPVELRHPELPVYRSTVTVEPGKRADLRVNLWSMVGRLTLEVNPWAEVLVDGVVQDTVPPQKRPIILTPGEHLLTLRHPLGRWDFPIQVEAGTEKVMRYNLDSLRNQ